MNVVRFGVSVEKDVLDLLDNYMKNNKFPNRSQAIRHLIKKTEMENKWNSNEIVGGSITLSFDHHRRELLDKLTEIQHQFYHVILCSQHIHLDHDICLEIIALKGKASELKDLVNQLTAVKGIMHSDLSITMVS